MIDAMTGVSLISMLIVGGICLLVGYHLGWQGCTSDRLNRMMER